MIIFATALPAEARPVISQLGLKQQCQINHQKFYRSGKYGLIITGIGKVASATGVARVLTEFPETRLIVNVGLCGAVSEQIPAETLYAIRSIRDHSTGRRFLPDIIIKHNLPETGLETWDHPVSQSYRDQVQADLVDMEASGFYEAASQQLASHQIHCLKIVSDHLDTTPPGAAAVREMVGRHTTAILEYAQQAELPDESEPHILDDRDEVELQNLFERWRCTATQQHQLRQSLAYARLRDGVRLADVQHFHKNSTDARQRDQLVDAIRKELTKR